MFLKKGSMKKTTIGEVALDTLKSKPSKPQLATKLAKETNNEKSYIQELRDCAERGCETYKDMDFYIEVALRHDKVLHNVLRNQFFAKEHCPTPNYDQSVFRFNHKTMDIEYIWTVPDKTTCMTLLYYADQVVPEERQTLDFVVKYATGQLLALAKTLNKEYELKPIIQGE
jgi:hypothetical protein